MSPFLKTMDAVWAFGALYWIVSALINRKAVQRREGLASYLRWRLMTLAGFALLFIPAAKGFWGLRLLQASDRMGWLGLVLCLGGMGFAIWARRLLGSQWSSAVTLKQGHELIQTGPYALSRHPIYTGFSAAALGVAIGAGGLQEFLGFFMICLAFRVKLGVEERFMRDHFGEAYDSYAKKVKRLIPFVY